MATFVDSLYNSYTPNKWLTYNDVLLLPDKSPFNSRNDPSISLATELTNNLSLDIPIISANMDTVTGSEMCIKMREFGGMGILHRFHANDDIYKDEILKVVNASGAFTTTPQVAFSVGCDSKWIDFTKNLLKNKYLISFVVCLDVAHGHMQQAIDTVKKFKTLKGEFVKNGIIMHIIAGNVVTPWGVRDLAEAGADVIKIGIGCFIAGTEVVTTNGIENIENIKIGDFVLTHRGNFKEVTDLPSREENKEILNIIKEKNQIKCTKNHEFYVLHKKYQNFVTDENIDSYAEWISAENLNSEYFLLEVN